MTDPWMNLIADVVRSGDRTSPSPLLDSRPKARADHLAAEVVRLARVAASIHRAEVTAKARTVSGTLDMREWSS